MASLYALGMIYAGGARYLLLSAILYFLGSGLFVLARKEQAKQLFTPLETVIFSALGLLAAVAVRALITGSIQL